MRAGLATAVAAAGMLERPIAPTAGHKLIVVLRGFVRSGSLFAENVAAAIGL